RAETEQAATVVLLSSPASSKAPGRRVARCSVPLLIINSCMSKQRSAGHRTVHIRPQALRAGSGVKGGRRAGASRPLVSPGGGGPESPRVRLFHPHGRSRNREDE